MDVDRGCPAAPLVSTDGQTIPVSTSEEDLMEANYKEVMTWIQETFPDIDMMDPFKFQKPRSMLEQMLGPSSKEPQIKMALPWSSGCSQILGNVQQVVMGEGPRRTQPLKINKMVPSFDFPVQFYHVRGIPKVETKNTNTRFEQLVPSSSKPAVKKPQLEMTCEEVANQEVSSLKALLASSSLDWQLITAATRLQNFIDQHPEFQELQLIRRLLLSAGRSTTQIQKETAVIHSNCILKRRDALLSLLPPQVPESQVLELRSSRFDIPELFSDDTLDKVAETLQSTLQREANLKVVVNQQNKKNFSKPKITVTVPSSSSGSSKETTVRRNFSRSSPSRPAAGKGKGRGRGKGRRTD